MIEGDLRFEAISGWAQVPVEAGFVEAVGAAVTWRDEVVVFARADIPVLIFSPEGRYLRGWGQGEFVRPHGIWIGKDDTLYLTDDMGHSVRQYSMSGQLLRMIGPSGTPSPTGIDGM
ncbi:MAG: 6-bladed beta-propeller, partial [Candidatus Latescibacterota bacterium]|nr:6-bladed beta-propeller [Candidatus Latescibacterota bacterium]